MRKHELDVFSLLAGMVFVAVAVVHLVTANTTHSTDVRWVFPGGHGARRAGQPHRPGPPGHAGAGPRRSRAAPTPEDAEDTEGL